MATRSPFRLPDHLFIGAPHGCVRGPPKFAVPLKSYCPRLPPCSCRGPRKAVYQAEGPSAAAAALPPFDVADSLQGREDGCAATLHQISPSGPRSDSAASSDGNGDDGGDYDGADVGTVARGGGSDVLSDGTPVSLCLWAVEMHLPHPVTREALHFELMEPPIFGDVRAREQNFVQHSLQA